MVHYIVVEGSLIRPFVAPLLRCLDFPESDYCILKVHEGIYKIHASIEVLAYKILSQGYYWPTIRHDCLKYVKTFMKCQKFTSVHRLSLVLPVSVLLPISFNTYGMDIMGLFPPAKGNVRYLLVDVDHMTKWIEFKTTAHMLA